MPWPALGNRSKEAKNLEESVRKSLILNLFRFHSNHS